MEEIIVTIYCLAYNHEKYIRSALDGFINQKTDFKYEVIVHDDASTDNTAAIIREYERKYPDIIKAIYQKENRWSKHINILNTYIYPRVKGKYIAICEGDDYWIDNNKLQKQVDYLDVHPECTFCFTNGIIVDARNKNKVRKFIPYSNEDRKYFDNESKIYTLENMYEVSFIPTASILYPTENLKRFPETFKNYCPVGDLKQRLYSTALGYAYYINDITCVYRQNVPGSAMTTWKTHTKKQEFERELRIINMINDVNEFSENKYEDGLYKLCFNHVYSLIKNSRNLSILKNDKYKRVFNELSLKKRAKCVCRIIMPQWILNIVRNCKSYVGK